MPGAAPGIEQCEIKALMGDKWLESSSAGKVLGVLLTAAQHKQQCALAVRKEIPHNGLNTAQPAGQKKRFSIVLSDAAASPLTLCRAAKYEKYKNGSWKYPEEQSWYRAGRHPLWGKAEDTGLSSLEKRRPSGDFTVLGSFLRRGSRGRRWALLLEAYSRTCRNGTKQSQGRVRLRTETISLSWGWSTSGPLFLERQQMSHTYQW